MAKKGGRKGGEKNVGGLPKPHARLSLAAQQDFQKMLDAADLDGDGEIDLEELHIAMESQAFKWEVSAEVVFIAHVPATRCL